MSGKPAEEQALGNHGRYLQRSPAQRKSEAPEGLPQEQANLEQGMNRAAEQLNAFSLAGGDVLFGTDVGYTAQFDTSEEFKWMSRAGMSYQQILASLTTNPTRRFGFSTRSGRIAKGFDADLVVLRADPSRDVAAFSHIRYTIRNGMVIYTSGS